jgi:hypothetical protein
VAECQITDVNNLLRSYSFMKDMQTWLKSRKEKGQPLPRDQNELRSNFKKERAVSYQEKLKQKQGHRWSKRDQNWNVKWTFASVQKRFQE